MSTIARRDLMVGLAGLSGLVIGSGRSPLLAATGKAKSNIWRDRSSPESNGISSSAILKFLDEVVEAGIELHSFMLARHDKVIAEGWWAPYRRNSPHSLYSVSKTFTSAAVGYAVAEGRLNLTDRIIDLFPDKTPRSIDARLRELQVRHLLTMSVGQREDPTAIVTQQTDWVRAFLETPIEYEPGSVWLYNNMATYTLSAAIQKVTGQTLLSYLSTRLLDPLRAEHVTWETCPLGINTGAWGLSTTTQTLLDFGQLYQNVGAWKGRRLLPANWIKESAASHIQQPSNWAYGIGHNWIIPPTLDAGVDSELRRDSDFYQGYGYQIWRCRHGAYRGNGAFGQLCIVMPDQNASLAVTASMSDIQTQTLLNLVWDRLLAAMHPAPLPRDAVTEKALQLRLETLSILPPKDGSQPALLSGVERIYTLEENELGWKRMHFSFTPSSCLLKVSSLSDDFQLECKSGMWTDGEMPNSQFAPEISIIHNSKRPNRPVKVSVAAAWTASNALALAWRYYETPHAEQVICQFDGDELGITFDTGDVAKGFGISRKPALRGHISQ